MAHGRPPPQALGTLGSIAAATITAVVAPVRPCIRRWSVITATRWNARSRAMNSAAADNVGCPMAEWLIWFGRNGSEAEPGIQRCLVQHGADRQQRRAIDLS